MPDSTIGRVRAFCAGRYNEQSRAQPAQAKAYLKIMNQCTDLLLASERPGAELLDWLSQPHADADLRRACALVFEMLGRG